MDIQSTKVTDGCFSGRREECQKETNGKRGQQSSSTVRPKDLGDLEDLKDLEDLEDQEDLEDLRG